MSSRKTVNSSGGWLEEQEAVVLAVAASTLDRAAFGTWIENHIRAFAG